VTHFHYTYIFYCFHSITYKMVPKVGLEPTKPRILSPHTVPFAIRSQGQKWQGWRDFNPQSTVPKTVALYIKLQPHKMKLVLCSPRRQCAFPGVQSGSRLPGHLPVRVT
jgi:hypothetical protein